MTVFRLRTLGAVELTHADGTPVIGVLSQPKRLGLLVYLSVANRGALCRRDTVLGVFWPDFDQERARAALRKALHFLRRELGNDVIVGRGDEEIGVDADRLSCDANAIRIARQHDEFETALSLYVGSFLDGFYIDDVPEFERWSAAMRHEVHAVAVAAAERLVRTAMEDGDADAAVRWANAWVRVASTDESAARALMTALASVGERARAQQAYDDLARRLHELDLEPSRETQALVEKLREDSAVNSTARADHVVAGVQGSSTTSRRLPWVAVAAIVAVIAVAYGAVRLTKDSASREQISIVSVRPFTNLTDDSALASVGTVYQRAIADGLAQVERVRVLALGDSSVATLTVSGSFYVVGDSLEFVAEIIDQARGRALPAPPPVRASADDPAAQADVIRHSVMGAVAYYTDLWKTVNPTRPPPNWEAYTTFQTALYTTLRGWSNPAIMATADSLFKRVIELDSLYTEAYYWLGGIYSSQWGPQRQRAYFVQRGMYAQMDSLVETIRTRVRPFTSLDRALAEFLDAMTDGDYDAAVRWAQEMQEMLPSKPNVPLLAAAGNGNRPWAALDETTKSYSDWYFDYWVSWFWLLTAFHLAGDYTGEAEAIDSARARPHLRFSWDVDELRTRAALGDLPRVRQLTENLNFDLAHFGALELRAHGLDRGDERLLDESDRLLDWILEWQHDRPTFFRKLLSYWAMSLRGRVDDLVVNLEGMTRDSSHLVDLKGMLGVAYARQGNVSAADSMDAILASADPSGLMGLIALWRGRIAAQRGSKDEAVRLLDRAFREGTWFQPRMPVDGGFWHTDPDFEPLRGYPPYERLIAPKR